MMQRWLTMCLMGVLFLGVFLVGLRAVHAQPGTNVTVTPSGVTLTGALPDGPFAGSLRLHTSATITNVRILVSDLQDVTDDQRLRDAIPSSNITLLPAAEFSALAANSLTQLVVQAAKPAAAGVYSGTLTVRWEKPTPGQLDVPVQIVARTKPLLALQDPANPAEIAINSQAAYVERHLLLRETSGGAPLTTLQPLSQDLLAADQRHILPASAITVTLARDAIGAGELLTATLHVTLAEAAAGAYKGALLFSARPDTLLTLPITINVRHGRFWPTVVVVAGVLLGLWISNYGAGGKVRDEYVVRIDAVREAIRADAELRSEQKPRNGFTLDLEQVIVEAEAALRAADWAVVDEKLKAATALLVKWRGNRLNWVTQIHHLRENLLPKLVAEKEKYDVPASAPLTLRKLEQATTDAIEDAATLKSPQELQDRATSIEENLAYFQSLQSRLEALGEARLKIAPTDAGLALQWTTLEQNFQVYDLSQPAVRTQFEQELKAMRDLLLQREAEASGLESMRSRAATIEEFIPLPPGVLAPSLKEVTAQEAAAAWKRLATYHWVTYLVGGLLLSALGLKTLYDNNPTFGANWLTDYLSLLLFGLGAETTSVSLVDLLRRWGVQKEK